MACDYLFNCTLGKYIVHCTVNIVQSAEYRVHGTWYIHHSLYTYTSEWYICTSRTRVSLSHKSACSQVAAWRKAMPLSLGFRLEHTLRVMWPDWRDLERSTLDAKPFLTRGTPRTPTCNMLLQLESFLPFSAAGNTSHWTFRYKKELPSNDPSSDPIYLKDNTATTCSFPLPFPRSRLLAKRWKRVPSSQQPVASLSSDDQWAVLIPLSFSFSFSAFISCEAKREVKSSLEASVPHGNWRIESEKEREREREREKADASMNRKSHQEINQAKPCLSFSPVV